MSFIAPCKGIAMGVWSFCKSSLCKHVFYLSPVSTTPPTTMGYSLWCDNNIKTTTFIHSVIQFILLATIMVTILPMH